MSLLLNKIGGGTVAVPCQLSGRETDCLLDTGATSSEFGTVDDSVKRLGKIGIRGSTGSVVQCDEVEANDVTIGNLQLRTLKGTHCPGIENQSVLGIDIFRSSSVRFDFSRKVITVGSGVSTSSRPLQVSNGGHFLIPIKIGNRVVTAVWDTGAGTSVIDHQLVNEMPNLFKMEMTATAVDAAGIEREIPIYSTEGMVIGGIEMPKSNFLVRDFVSTRQNLRNDVAVILGVNIIKNYVWAFDPIQKAWEISTWSMP
jgi:predicted aspartyl protease